MLIMGTIISIVNNLVKRRVIDRDNLIKDDAMPTIVLLWPVVLLLYWILWNFKYYIYNL